MIFTCTANQTMRCAHCHRCFGGGRHEPCNHGPAAAVALSCIYREDAPPNQVTRLSWRLWATLGLQWATLCMVSYYPKCHIPSNHAKSSWRSHASHIQIHESHMCPTSNKMAWTPTLLHQVLAKKALPQHHCHGKQQSSTKASCAGGGGGAGDHGGDGVVFIRVSHFGWLVPSLLISFFTVLCPQVQKNGLASICANGWATKWNCLFLVPFI